MAPERPVRLPVTAAVRVAVVAAPGVAGVVVAAVAGRRTRTEFAALRPFVMETAYLGESHASRVTACWQ